jgi:hypothetical protein
MGNGSARIPALIEMADGPKTKQGAGSAGLVSNLVRIMNRISNLGGGEESAAPPPLQVPTRSNFFNFLMRGKR